MICPILNCGVGATTKKFFIIILELECAVWGPRRNCGGVKKVINKKSVKHALKISVQFIYKLINHIISHRDF